MIEKTTTTFLERLQVARDGSPDEKAEFLESFREGLRELAVESLGSQRTGKLSASDIVQSAIINANDGLDKCRAESLGEFRGWLKRILVHELVNRHRALNAQKRDVRRERPIDAAHEARQLDKSPSAEVILAEDRDRLAVALTKLSDGQRQVITLRNRDRLSWAEIASVMEKSTDAVQKLWERAIQQLAKLLKEPE